MTQEHCIGPMRDDDDLDPLFKSLLKHHWMEEAQPAKLDTLIVDTLAEGRSEREIAAVTNEFLKSSASLIGHCWLVALNSLRWSARSGRRLNSAARSQRNCYGLRAGPIAHGHEPQQLQGHACRNFNQFGGAYHGSSCKRAGAAEPLTDQTASLWPQNSAR